MTFSGYIKLILNDCIIDKKVYCSKEDREEIIIKWSNLHSRFFQRCYIQIMPSLNRVESIKLMNRADREKWLNRLQKESKERYGIIEPAKKVNFEKLKNYVEEKPVAIVRPPAKYDNIKSYEYK